MYKHVFISDECVFEELCKALPMDISFYKNHFSLEYEQLKENKDKKVIGS